MKRSSRIVLCLAIGLLTACASVDRNAAASLGTAGQQATSTLSTQTAQASQVLGELNQWWAVYDTLACASVDKTTNPAGRVSCVGNAGKPGAEQKSVDQLIDILTKRKQAIDTLNQAYGAFVDLAHYNAGSEATAALKTSFTDINTFLGAVSTLPGVGAIAPIGTTIEKVSGGIVSVIADSRQNALILAANSDLKTANDALYQGLTAEKSVMTRLLTTLQEEKETLYQRGFDVGLISPTDILTPLFTQVYPGIRLQSPPAANNDIVVAAAKKVVAIENRATNSAIANSYTNALDTLDAVSKQHQKLADSNETNLSQIEADVSSLQANIAQVDSPSKSATK